MARREQRVYPPLRFNILHCNSSHAFTGMDGFLFIRRLELAMCAGAEPLYIKPADRPALVKSSTQTQILSLQSRALCRSARIYCAP